MPNKRLARNKLVVWLFFVFAIILYLPTVQYLFVQTRFPYDGWDRLVPWIALIIAGLSHRQTVKDRFHLRPSPKGLILIAAAILLQAGGLFGSMPLQLCSLAVMLAGIVVFMGGRDYLKYFAFAIFILLFKLPWGEYLFSWFGVEPVVTWYAVITKSLLSKKYVVEITPRYSGWHTLDLKILTGLLFLHFSKKLSLQQKIFRSIWLIPGITAINIIRVWTLFLAWNMFVPTISIAFIHQVSDVLHKLVLLGFFAWLALL